VSARYSLWSEGEPLAKYATLQQALLGAVWRSRKLGGGRTVGVYTRTKTGGDRCVATVLVPSPPKTTR
jgi:hypothetical protein